jgi:hypothetical protein
MVVQEKPVYIMAWVSKHRNLQSHHHINNFASLLSMDMYTHSLMVCDKTHCNVLRYAWRSSHYFVKYQIIKHVKYPASLRHSVSSIPILSLISIFPLNECLIASQGKNEVKKDARNGFIAIWDRTAEQQKRITKNDAIEAPSTPPMVWPDLHGTRLGSEMAGNFHEHWAGNALLLTTRPFWCELRSKA